MCSAVCVLVCVCVLRVWQSTGYRGPWSFERGFLLSKPINRSWACSFTVQEIKDIIHLLIFGKGKVVGENIGVGIKRPVFEAYALSATS